MTDNDNFGNIPIAGGDLPAEKKPITIEAKDPKTAPKKEPGPSPRKRRQLPSSNRWIILAIGSITLAALIFAAVGYLLVPYLTTTFFTDRLAARLDRSVTIAKADFDPFNLTLTLHNCIIGPKLSQKDDSVDPVLSFGKATIDLEAIGLITGKIITQSLEAEQLFVHLVRHKNGQYNLMEMAQKAWPQKTNNDTPAYSLNNISIRESRLIFDDQPAGKSHSVAKINLALPSLSNISYQTSQYIKPEFSGEINGSPISLTGETSVQGETLEAKLAVKLSGIDLPGYLVYLPKQFRLKATKGTADINGDLIFSFTPGKEINLKFTGNGTVANLAILDHEGNVNKIAKATFNGIISPLQKSYLLNKIEIVKPEVHLDKNKAGLWNFSWLTAANRKNQDTRPQDLTLEVKQLSLTNGKFHITDRQIKGGFQDTWSEIQCSIKNFNNNQTAPASFAISGASNSSARFSAQGKITSSPFKAEGLLVVNKVKLARLNPYLKAYKKLQINNGLATQFQSRFLWQTDANQQAPQAIKFDEITAKLEKLLISRDDHEWLRVPTIGIKDGGLDLTGKTIQLGNVHTTGGAVVMAWDEQGKLNWQDLQIATQATNKNNPGWQFKFKSLQIDGGTVSTRTRRLATTPFAQTIRNLSLTLRPGNKDKGKLKASANLGGKGTLLIEGDLDLAPLKANLSCRIQNYNIVSLQPFFKDWLKPRVSKGLLGGQGQITYPSPTFTGKLEITDFAAIENKKQIIAAIENKNQIMAADKIIAPNIKISAEPLSLQIDTLQIETPRLAWVHRKKGSAPDDFFQKTVKNHTTFKIGKITVEQGSIAFSDQNISPPYSANISRINGSISGIANKADNKTHLDLTGTFKEKSPIIIAGDFSFFAPQPTIRCQVGLAGVALKDITAYSEPVFGYHFTAGTLKLASIIERKEGNIFVNSQFAFDKMKLGARTNGSQQLPMTLALVSDENRRFTFNMSSQGKVGPTNDFSYRKSITKHIRGLLAKATVSPFTVLKNSLPDHPFATTIPFKPGKTEITPDQQQKLNQLRHLLKKRPQLMITLTGTVDDLTDRKALLDKLMKQEDEKRRKKEAQLSKSLSATYGKEEIAPTKPLPTPAITEEIFYDESSIKKSSLLKLAGKRAANSVKYMTQALAIPADRLKLLPPRLLIADNPAQQKSRVDFGLKLYVD